MNEWLILGKGDRFLIFHRKKKRSHSQIPQVRSHPHPLAKAIALSNSTNTIAPTSPKTIALSNPTSTIAPTSIPKRDRTLQLNKYDRTNIHHQKRSHSPIEQVRSHQHPSSKAIAPTSIPKHDMPTARFANALSNPTSTIALSN
ncbi:hypothetical protein [Argonema antarcticum]|uniref:hypothetical protein n=1 Tax=Argonema antarcticum TaxID=2942763 RepID=UPI0020135673|nr:hypothetical protein [Argonema antarcticum]MCL1473795.1 hypothetical protein [Argonema antarcticum A004/B2]